MKVGIMQPYFLPYIGYFQLINAVDLFVVYDDVQYIKRGWINRNKMLVNNKEYIFTLEVKKDIQESKINERYFGDNHEVNIRKLIIGIERAYKKAPFYNEVMPIIINVFKYNPESDIGDFIYKSIKEVCDYLNINTKIVKSSQLEKPYNLKGQDKILNIVERLKGDTYINSIGGTKLYSKEVFNKKNINLKFIKTKNIIYRQYGKEFIPNLSILDVLMFNSKDEVSRLLTKYELI